MNIVGSKQIAMFEIFHWKQNLVENLKSFSITYKQKLPTNSGSAQTST